MVVLEAASLMYLYENYIKPAWGVLVAAQDEGEALVDLKKTFDDISQLLRASREELERSPHLCSTRVVRRATRRAAKKLAQLFPAPPELSAEECPQLDLITAGSRIMELDSDPRGLLPSRLKEEVDRVHDRLALDLASTMFLRTAKENSAGWCMDRDKDNLEALNSVEHCIGLLRKLLHGISAVISCVNHRAPDARELHGLAPPSLHVPESRLQGVPHLLASALTRPHSPGRTSSSNSRARSPLQSQRH